MDWRTIMILLALAVPAQAFGGGTAYRSMTDGTLSFSDRGSTGTATLAIEETRVGVQHLRGTWTAHGADGVLTELKLSPGGGFVFDRRDTRSPQRLYMCGNWSTTGKDIELDVRAKKEQLATGRIIEHSRPPAASFAVLAAHAELLILRLSDGNTVSFRRDLEGGPGEA